MSTTTKNLAAGWISARHVQHMIAHGEAVGLRMDEILGKAGLTRAMLGDPEGLVPLDAIEEMLAALSRRYDDPPIGLNLASDIQPATFGAIGYISQACSTFGDMFDVLVRFNGLLSNIGQVSVVHGPGTVQLCWECSAGGEAFRRQATDYVLGAFAVLARLLVPELKGLMLAVNFAHAGPKKAEQRREYQRFFACPVYFDQPMSSVLMAASLLNSKMHHGDAFVKDMLERHAANLLQKREQDQLPLTEQVRRLVAAQILDGEPTKERVALQLGMSKRSLARRLLELNASYQQILDEVRLDIVRSRLRESADSVADLSVRLSFNSPQALIRWFKNMTGQTPGEYRKVGKEDDKDHECSRKSG